MSISLQILISRALPILLALASVVSAQAKPVGNMSGTEYFERRVRPLLVKHCYECHSEEEGKQKGGLLLDRESGWLEGGDTGKAVVPGQPGASLLIESVQRVDEDSAMPPKYSLEADELEILLRWVKAGAPGPEEDMGETKFSQLGDQTVIFEKAAEHWAFQPIQAKAAPEVDDPKWNQNPIDRFVFAKLKAEKLSPSAPADSRTLIRRLSYSLTGLPPTDPELFSLKTEELIEKLIDSPQYGEHVARLWLDVARYADTASTYRPDTKTPHYYPYAFTYRDYVVAAFNEDKPFDQFVKEQLAADLLDFGKDAPELAALGFLGVSPHRSMSHDFVDDVIDATTRGFLGLTVSCARCHDHKFEPIPTADYYSLYGVFNSINRPAPWALNGFPLIGGYAAKPDQVAEYEKQLAGIEKKIKEAGNKKNKGNNRSLKDTIEQTELAELLLFHDGAPVRAMSVSESGKPVQPAVFIRGEASSRGDRIPRRFLKILDSEQAPFNAKDSGRLDLAGKLVDPKNPLTARVYVNRIWGLLMGDFLVDTPSDFGLQGELPSHPELLDFLATDFVKNGSSTKHLVRLIVSSKTFQQSSSHREDMAAIDPENELFWKANRKRLRFEELRDSLLAVSGQLDLTMRGRPGQLWGDEYTKRRSLYGYVNRFNLDPTLRNFDFPSPMQTQGSRTDNIVPPQALFLMNSPFIVEQAGELVKSLSFTDSQDRPARVAAIYERVLQRAPSESELTRIGRFIDVEKGRKVPAWPLVAQSLCMSNEFLYVDLMDQISPLSRRAALQRVGFGFGALAASDLLANLNDSDSPLAPRQPHFPATAKRVIHLFMNGGPSQMDTFDPKPTLEKLDGKTLPDSIKETLQQTQRNRVGTVWASPFKFSKHGQSGLEISELYPNVAKHADKLCVIRSMQSEIANHSPGLLMMNCGHPVLARPSIGSWALYGLGTQSEDLPGYVVLMPSGMPTAQSRNWTSSFLPGVYQGTHIETNAKGGEMIPHLNRKDIRSGTQRNQMALTQFLNQRHLRARPGDERLDSRIHSMELAFRMQSAATDAFDITKEPEGVREAYGDTPVGRNLLMARRLAERGVRYIQCYHGAGQPWDNHSGLIPRIKQLTKESDQPIAALLEDLEERGMLEDTLVVWGGEMGRTSTIQKTGQKDQEKWGRDHHVDGFTVWMAGGGVKGGMTYGETDEFALSVAADPVHVHDLHATMLHLLGFDHERLTYRYSGRDFRLTDVHGKVVKDILA